MKARSIILTIVLLAVLLPTSLFALLLTSLFGASLVVQSLSEFRSSALPFMVLYLLIAAGWVGIITLWRIYFHFRRTDKAPSSRTWHFIGLLLGISASATFVISFFSASYPVTSIIFGWPLIGAAYLGYILWRAPIAS